MHVRGPHATAEPFEELQASLVTMMNRYATEPCCCLAAHISYQVEKLLRHPLIDLFPELRKQYAQSLGCWKARASLAHAGDDHAIVMH